MVLPRISIVTPSFNQGEYIGETINSVLSQNYPNLQYVIIDGGSDDNTVNVIREYENFLDYWVSEKDNGHGDALNKGFAKCDGEIMAWINSDDKYAEGSFHAVAEIFSQNPMVEWIVGGNMLLDKDGNVLKVGVGQKNIYDYLNSDYRWITQESVFWRRSLWDRSGAYISDSHVMVDGELWSRFFLSAELFAVEKTLAGFRYHGDNRSACLRDICLQEMNDIIVEMRKAMPSEVIKIANYLKVINKFRKLPFVFNSFFILFKKLHQLSVKYYPVGYRKISNFDGIWRIGDFEYK